MNQLKDDKNPYPENQADCWEAHYKKIKCIQWSTFALLEAILFILLVTDPTSQNGAIPFMLITVLPFAVMWKALWEYS